MDTIQYLRCALLQFEFLSFFYFFGIKLKNHTVWKSKTIQAVCSIIFYTPEGLAPAHFWWHCPFKWVTSICCQISWTCHIRREVMVEWGYESTSFFWWGGGVRSVLKSGISTNRAEFSIKDPRNESRFTIFEMSTTTFLITWRTQFLLRTFHLYNLTFCGFLKEIPC